VRDRETRQVVQMCALGANRCVTEQNVRRARDLGAHHALQRRKGARTRSPGHANVLTLDRDDAMSVVPNADAEVVEVVGELAEYLAPGAGSRRAAG
jgi:hypothetical protein